MNIKQRTSVLVRVLLSLWLTLFVACDGDNSVSYKFNKPPVTCSPNCATVTAAELSVDQPNWIGKCPHRFQLTGTITTSGPGRVLYRFRDDDGGWTTPLEILEFKSAETKTVTATTDEFLVSMSFEWGMGLEIHDPFFPTDWVMVKTTCE